MTRKELAIKRHEISQHKNRPTSRDYIPYIFDEFIELHGDRGYADDKAIMCGIGKYNGVPVTVIAHVKGRNTKENIEANFGSPFPEGYRKALRFMKQADKFKRPIITLVDTPGAYPGPAAEERGQGEAIARNLFEMSRLRVPVIAIITGTGSSGGALGIAQANCVLMLENATYSVISARGFASIIWKDPKREEEAVTQQRMTSDDLLELGIIDGVIPEPEEGAHKDAFLTAAAIKTAIEPKFNELIKMLPEDIYNHRYKKFREIGFFNEI
jgi:acetyl-CoA carboxylase carboxyl transferase subunit alpha